MKELHKQIIDQIDAFMDNSNKAIAGNSAAGARSRKNTLNLEKLFKQWRKESVAASKKQD